MIFSIQSINYVGRFFSLLLGNLHKPHLRQIRKKKKELDKFLDDKEDCAYLDFHQSLAGFHIEVGKREKAIKRYKIYVTELYIGN